MRLHLGLRQIGDAESVQRRLEDHTDGVEHHLALYTHPNLASRLLEFPGV
jgi:hypothetical protein